MQLLLDNAPSHPRDSTLMSNDSLITETFRPHIKAIIQLMDQNLTTSMERSYQADLLRSFPKGDGNITAFCRKTKVFGTIYIYEV